MLTSADARLIAAAIRYSALEEANGPVWEISEAKHELRAARRAFLSQNALPTKSPPPTDPRLE